MNLFKTYSFRWWQIGIFKLALMAIGILIGSYWSNFWNEITSFVIIVAVAASVYIMYVSLKQ